MVETKGVVCVTGGTGFIASWLIKRLLQQGYTVRTTVRSSSAERRRDISYLTNLPGAKEQLQVFNADLDNPESFNEAIEGCKGVFHLAFPIDFVDKEPEEIVTKRAIEGTLGILKACLNSKTVKRVVISSSQASTMFTGNGEEVLDENAWTDIDYYRSLSRMGASYVAAKTKTGMAAIEFAEQHGLDLVMLTPALVVGPFLCPYIPDSLQMALALIFRNKDMYHVLVKPNMVHVDDVASAYIFLFEYPEAKGKYICSSHKTTLNELSEFLSARYPDLQMPSTDSLKDVQGYKYPGLSSKKLLDCGYKFKHRLGDMFDGAIQSCKEKGFL